MRGAISRKLARRITVVEVDPTGATTTRELYSRKRKRKKGSRIARPLERMVRRQADALAASADTYARRHRRSNSKRRDGWIRDYAINVLRANDKGAKKLKLRRLF